MAKMSHLKKLAKSMELDIHYSRPLDDRMYFEYIAETQLMGYPDNVRKLAAKLTREELVLFALYVMSMGSNSEYWVAALRTMATKPRKN